MLLIDTCWLFTIVNKTVWSSSSVFCFYNFKLFLYTLNNKITLFSKYIKSFNQLIKFVNFLFHLSYHHTYMLSKLVFTKNTILPCFFSLVINLYFLIPAAVAQIFNFIAELVILRWCCARDLFGLQIPVTTGGTWWPSGLGNYFVCKRLAVQTLLWSLEFVIQINLEHNTIAVWNLARSRSDSSLNLQMNTN